MLKKITFNYIEIMIIVLSLQVINESLSQFLRGVGKIKLYVLNGIILTFCIGFFNIIFIVVFKLGVIGYFISLLISNLISFLFLFVFCKLYSYIDISLIKKKSIIKLLNFSMPLIPNAIMWWLINSSTRYFLYYFVGSEANGLFAVASKIPSLLTIITTIFFQAWQLSAVEEYESETKSKFYSDIFKYYSQVLFMCTSFIILILKPTMNVIVSEAFFESWKIIPVLLLSVVYSSFSTFLGTNYIAAKKTNGVFTSSLIRISF